MNIVLVGFMGTGKTEVAKCFSKVSGLKYISTDELIEEREAKTINEIFREKGEKYFRMIEKEVVKEVSKLDNVIIDAGGGVMLDEENVINLRKRGITICLQARPEVILDRMKDKNNRPLLKVENKLAKIKELLNQRTPYYQKADYFIETSGLTIDEIIEKIKDLLKLASGKH